MELIFYKKLFLKDVFEFVKVVYFPIGNAIKWNFMSKAIRVFAPIVFLLFEKGLAPSNWLPVVFSVYFYKYIARGYIKVKTITTLLEVIEGLLSFKLYRTRAQYTYYFIFIRTHFGLRKLLSTQNPTINITQVVITPIKYDTKSN